jgi:hypothetical protein
MRMTFAPALLAASALASPTNAQAVDAMGPILATAPDAATQKPHGGTSLTQNERRKASLEQDTAPSTNYATQTP